MMSRWLLYLQLSYPHLEEEEGRDQWFSLSQALVEKGSLPQELLPRFHSSELSTRGAGNLRREEKS